MTPLDDDFDRDEARYGPDATVLTLEATRPRKCVRCGKEMDPGAHPDRLLCIWCCAKPVRNVKLPSCPQCRSRFVDCLLESGVGYKWQCLNCGHEWVAKVETEESDGKD